MYSTDPLSLSSSSLTFFTYWVIVLVVFHTWTHACVDLLLLTLLVLVVASYILYVANGRFILVDRNSNSVEFNSRDIETLFIHLVFHVIPFVAMYVLYFDYYMSYFDVERFVLTILLVLSFMAIVDYGFVYGIEGPEVPLVGAATISFYAFIFCVFVVLR